MKILVTGAKGFVGKNLCSSLKNIRDGKDRREKFQALLPLTLFEYDTDSTSEDLALWAKEADFVFNLAGVNRPLDSCEFMQGNCDFVRSLLELLESAGSTAPVMLSSSIQASLAGRYSDSEYGKSKLAGEELFREYSERTGTRALIYRFPNLFGKWCRPNYNSVVATFCYNISRDLPITVSNPDERLELLYIDDLIQEMLEALLGSEHRCEYEGIRPLPKAEGDFCYVPKTHDVSLGEIVSLLEEFRKGQDSQTISMLEEGCFSKKLLSTYMSYVPEEKVVHCLKKNSDHRGSFTELFHTADRGQVSVNVSLPGVVKGNHWHHSKWEKFCVVSGEGLIRVRRIGRTVEGEFFPVIEYRVSGDTPVSIDIAPGYTHSIENVSEKEDLITIIWANEIFDPSNPDTYYCEVQPNL